MSVSCSVVRRVDLEDAREGVTAMVTCQGFAYVTHSVRSSVWAYTAQGELHFQQSLPGLEVSSPSANTKHLYNINTMLDQRQRRWADFV